MSVTLLFTDLEGSTQLAHRLGARYAALLADHRSARARRGRRVGRPRARLPRRRVLDRVRRGRRRGRRRRGDPARAYAARVAGRAGARADRDPHRRAVARGRRLLRDRRPPRLAALRGRARRTGAALAGGARAARAAASSRATSASTCCAACPRPSGSTSCSLPAWPTRIRRCGRRRPRQEKKLRVVLADDSVLLREGIARLLEDAGFDIVGRSGDGDDLMLKVRSYSPDVAIVDIRMPPTHTDEGLRAAAEIREKHPGTGVLVLSQYLESGYALELLSDERRGRRLSAQGPCRRRRRVLRGRAARRRGRLGARSRGRLAPRRPPPARRSDRRS